MDSTAQAIALKTLAAQEEANRLASEANKLSELAVFVTMLANPKLDAYSISINQKIRELSGIKGNR